MTNHHRVMCTMLSKDCFSYQKCWLDVVFQGTSSKQGRFRGYVHYWTCTMIYGIKCIESYNDIKTNIPTIIGSYPRIIWNVLEHFQSICQKGRFESLELVILLLNINIANSIISNWKETSGQNSLNLFSELTIY